MNEQGHAQKEVYCISNGYVFPVLVFVPPCVLRNFYLTRFAILISIRKLMRFMKESKANPCSFFKEKYNLLESRLPTNI